MTRQLVAGAGEVGTALGEVLDAPTWEPLDQAPPVDLVDVLHIAIPWHAGFVDQVQGWVDDLEPHLVIVHSTVPVGTCDPHRWVHSPVTGRHPHLTESLTTFRKHVGGRHATTAAALLAHHGIQPAIHNEAATTEAGKLLQLARLAVEVRVEKEIHRLCQRLQLGPGEVYREFAYTYNRGYQQLGEHRFTLPVLDHMPGPIGGHCVAENVPLLPASWFQDILDPLTKEGWTGDLD